MKKFIITLIAIMATAYTLQAQETRDVLYLRDCRKKNKTL